MLVRNYWHWLWPLGIIVVAETFHHPFQNALSSPQFSGGLHQPWTIRQGIAHLFGIMAGNSGDIIGENLLWLNIFLS
jgi:hypothetical protein